MFNENQLVHLLETRFGGTAAGLKKGIGDDAAVILPRNAAEYWAITTDMLLEDIDFRRDWLTPEQLGHKSLAVNLSDLAAMGALPRFYTVALALPDGISGKWIARYYKGLRQLGEAQGGVLIGGDLSRSVSGIQICIAAFGESKGRKLVYRSGGKAGDAVFVTGVLGRSAAGLELLKRGSTRGTTKAQRQVLQAQRMPEPRCAAGFWLAQQNIAASMMDLSDGLSVDLPRLCDASGTGAVIDAAAVPVFPAVSALGCDPLALALHGGEDFELLFTVPARKIPTLIRTYPASFPKISRIGELTGRKGDVRLRCDAGRSEPLPQLGFDHFRS